MLEKNAALKSNFISMICLLIFIFLYCGWKIGLISFLMVIIIDYTYIFISNKKIKKIKTQFDKKIKSGALPYSCYFESDALGIRYNLIFDPKLSPISTGNESPGFIIFITKQGIERIIKSTPKEAYISFSEMESYYNYIKKNYDTCEYSIYNIEIIKESMEVKRIIDDADEVGQAIEEIKK